MPSAIWDSLPKGTASSTAKKRRMRGSILILSGPPGAGKTTVAARVAKQSEAPSVHLRHDDFLNAIASGSVAPWLPTASSQNETVVQALAAAASVYSQGGYFVVVDGVLGGSHLESFRAVEAVVTYIVLRPDEETTVARARDREVGPLADYPPRIYQAFSGLAELEPHALDTSALSIDETLGLIRSGLNDPLYRLS